MRADALDNADIAFSNVSKNTLIWVKGKLNVSGRDWYAITYQDVDCYIWASLVKVMSQEESDNVNKPEGSITPINLFGKVNTNGIKIRTEALTNASIAFDNVPQDERVWVKGSLTIENREWYSISYKNVDCFVWANLITLYSQEESDKILSESLDPVKVTVNYIDSATNTPFFTESIECAVGKQTTVIAKEQAGYTLTTQNEVIVDVNLQGVANPSEVNFTFDKDLIPATVYFSFVDENNNPIAETTNQVLSPSTYTSSDFVIELVGYTYLQANYNEIIVNQDGTANTNEVVFTYQKTIIEPAKAEVIFTYLDSDTKVEVGPKRTEYLVEGIYNSQSYNMATPEDYKYMSVSADTITVNSEGIATSPNVVFYFIKVPKSAEITVEFLDEKENIIAPEQKVTLQVGEYSIEELGLIYPPHYDVTHFSADKLIVNEEGIANPDVLKVYCKETPPLTADVTFNFIDESGNEIIPSKIIPLEVGPHNSNEYVSVIEGYNHLHQLEQTIVVDESGVATPSEITFVYQAKITAAQIEVNYLNQIGSAIQTSPDIRTLTPGTHIITPEVSLVPAPYIIAEGSIQSVEVVVNDKFFATPSEVNFNYVDSSITTNLPIKYVDVTTNHIIVSKTIPLSYGTHNITPEKLPELQKYKLSDINSNVMVTVNSFGVAAPKEVIFYYEPINQGLYIGYALTTTQVALRNAYNNLDSSIVKMLPTNTLLFLNTQQTIEGVSWSAASMVIGDDLSTGVVQEASLRRITKEEANKIIEHNKPVIQDSGYYITLGSGVPLRNMPNETSIVDAWLPNKSVVYVYSQELHNSLVWHKSYSYDYSLTGYIRDTQLRKMTQQEIDAYLAGHHTKPPSPSVAPFDPYGKSSYGYVSSSTVNFRATPNGAKIDVLKQYAFALILEQRVVDGITWYKINYNGKTGYIHGDFFHNLNMTELTNFLYSPEYEKGIKNNSHSQSTIVTPPPSSGHHSSGSSSVGGMGSVEDYNTSTWKNPNLGAVSTYVPYNPYSTTSPKPTSGVTVTTSPKPTQTVVIGTMIPIDYEDQSIEEQTSSNIFGILPIILGIIVVIGGGGYAFYVYQNKMRKETAAKVIAQRKAEQQKAKNSTSSSPYAKRVETVASVSHPTSTTQVNSTEQANSPYAKPTNSSNPFASSSLVNEKASDATATVVNPYARPTTSEAEANNATTKSYNNPYATPISTFSSSTLTPPTETTIPVETTIVNSASESENVSTGKRASRMQRYQQSNDQSNDQNS